MQTQMKRLEHYQEDMSTIDGQTDSGSYSMICMMALVKRLKNVTTIHIHARGIIVIGVMNFVPRNC